MNSSKIRLGKMHAQRFSLKSIYMSRSSLYRHAAKAQHSNVSTRYLQCGTLRDACQAVTQQFYRHDTGRAVHFRHIGKRNVATCCASAPEASSSASTPIGEQVTEHPSPSPKSTLVACTADATFTSSYGMHWRVRPYDNSDYAAVIEVQTDSFHTTNPVPFLNDLTYNNFRAEVVDALRQKIKYSDPSSFQLLVAEHLPIVPLRISAAADSVGVHANAAEVGGSSEKDGSSDNGDDASDANTTTTSRSSSSGGGSHESFADFGAASLVGSVEVSLMRAREVLSELPRSVREYAYISSMCVRLSVRRRGAAQALMAAAEAQARRWRQPHLALHVYKDNAPAVELYRRCGMRVIAEDPSWKGMIGMRLRLLMYKELALEVGDAEGTIKA
ncbi:hypothetical protein Vretimale_13317 [Volvox reticuliferus]|uniref:N-acetyltransferase domain-containing protein n=1 Tax=Volvox reticuliferus TaxID=1737510 RepID=A0A8J4CLG5_9CHLO|nr:hypothetical protein Vretifemale_14080 [Volvox reticuliferus]GIM09457.1 hypothetical protein Vretimale_13317 [Volvox reticuliferus]